MNWFDDTHYEDKETGITGWGFLPTPDQQADRDAVFIMELHANGYTLAEVLPTRSRRARVNWRHGDPNEYLETHWQIFEPGYASEEDEKIAEAANDKIDDYRHNFTSVFCIEPSTDMKLEAGYFEELPEGHRLIAVMVKGPKEAQGSS